MFKATFAALALLFLISCQTTTTEKVAVVEKSVQLPGQVVAILELCKSFEDQMDIFKEYSKSAVSGMQLYYAKIYAGQCVTFPKPVLAKKVKLEFEKQVDKRDKIEIWKIALSEEEENVTFFWIAIRIITEKPDNAKNQIAA